MRAQAMFDSASFMGSARQKRRMPLRASVRNASAMKSGLAVSQDINLKPVDMNCNGVFGVAAAMSRIRSHGSSFLYRTATPMCVEVVKSMARKPTRSMTSAMPSVLAVSSPKAAHRHWLPSRSEVSINCTSAMGGTVRVLIAEVRPAGIQSVDEARIHPPGLKFRIVQRGTMEAEIALHPADARRSDCAAQARQRSGAIRTRRDDLAHQRIIERRNAGSGYDVSIHANAFAGGP